jgi:hypothetical protein
MRVSKEEVLLMALDPERTRDTIPGKSGRRRGGGRQRLPQERNDFSLPQLAAANYDSLMENSVLKYGYREDHFTKNQDRLMMIVRCWKLSLNGYHKSDPDTDGSFPTSHYGDYAETDFWPKTHLFNWWIQMAQMRDDYNPTANTLYDTSWNTIRDHDELVITAIQVASVLWTMLHSGGYNLACKQVAAAGIGYRRRLQRVLVELLGITYPEKLNKIYDYWRRVFMPYENGPVIVNLFMFDHLNTDHTSGYNGWSMGTPPDLTNSTDWGSLIVNLERAVEELNGLNLATANRLTDFLVWQYHANMVGMSKPSFQAMSADVDFQKWEEQFVRGDVALYDSVGSRGLISDFVINSNHYAQKFVQRDFAMDELDWMGLKTPYAFLTESNDFAYAVGSQWIFSMGIVMPGYDPTVGYPISTASYYTREDGMFEAVYNFDISAAAGVQALLWKRPDLMVNANFPALVFAEESEEHWREGMLYPGKFRAHVVPNDIAQGFARYLHDTYNLPFNP